MLIINFKRCLFYYCVNIGTPHPPELLCLIELVEIGLKCCNERKQRRLIETINKKDIKKNLNEKNFLIKRHREGLVQMNV